MSSGIIKIILFYIVHKMYIIREVTNDNSIIKGERSMKIEWKTCFKLIVTAFVIFLLIYYWAAFSNLMLAVVGASSSLLVGCAIAYVVNILMSFYEKYYIIICKNSAIQKLKRPFCMILAFLTVLLILVVLFQMIFPQLAACVAMLIETLPKTLSNVYLWLEEHFGISQYLSNGLDEYWVENINWVNVVRAGVNFLVNGVGGAMNSILMVLSSFFSVMVTLFLGTIFSIYLLGGKEKLGRNFMQLMHTYMSKEGEDRLLYVLRTVNGTFHNFIVGQCVEAVIIGSLCMLGMWIFRFPYVTMIGCLVGCTALIPVAGAYIGAFIGAFMIFTVSPIKAILFLVFLGILQQIEDNLIYPRVVGSSIGLPGVWVLTAVTIGGGVLGIAGMLLGVPLAAAAYQLLRRDVINRNNQGKKVVPLREKMKLSDKKIEQQESDKA